MQRSAQPSASQAPHEDPPEQLPAGRHPSHAVSGVVYQLLDQTAAVEVAADVDLDEMPDLGLMPGPRLPAIHTHTHSIEQVTSPASAASHASRAVIEVVGSSSPDGGSRDSKGSRASREQDSERGSGRGPRWLMKQGGKSFKRFFR